MAGDRDGNRRVDGMRPAQRRQQSDRSDTGVNTGANTRGNTRGHRRFLQSDHHRIINLFGEFAIRDAPAQLRRERFSYWCGVQRATVSPCDLEHGNSHWHGLRPDAHLFDILV